MRLLSALLYALVAPRLIAATALTYRLAPSENACFFASVETAGSKIAFYFAVRGHLALFAESFSHPIDLTSNLLDSPCLAGVSVCEDQNISPFINKKENERLKFNIFYAQFCPSRFNPADLLTSITASSPLMARSSWKRPKSDKEILSSRPKRRANIGFVSTMT